MAVQDELDASGITVVRTLTGGLDRCVDWVIVAKLFPDFNAVFLNRAWSPIWAQLKSELEKLQYEFQEAFLKAYAAGVVPPIDYDNLLEYDWRKVVKWALKTLHLPGSEGVPNLPPTREQLEEEFIIKEYAPAPPWRDAYFGFNVAVIKRVELIYENAEGVPLDAAMSEQVQEDPQKLIGKTWIRANVLTAQEVYDPETAQQKLMLLGNELLEGSLKELCSERMVMHAHRGRMVPGRSYDVTAHFYSCLKKAFKESALIQAAIFKTQIDQAFRDTGIMRVSYNAGDGENLALTNMVASQRVRLVACNVPANAYGLLDGGYRTRFMDKERLFFDVDVVPTDTYEYGNPIDSPLPPAPMSDPARHATTLDGTEAAGEPFLPIPLWFDIYGNFIPLLWRKVLAAVLSILIMRTGITTPELHRCLRPSLYLFDLEMVLDWLVQAKAVTKVATGWQVDEWWWLVIPPLAEEAQQAETNVQAAAKQLEAVSLAATVVPAPPSEQAPAKERDGAGAASGAGNSRRKGRPKRAIAAAITGAGVRKMGRPQSKRAMAGVGKKGRTPAKGAGAATTRAGAGAGTQADETIPVQAPASERAPAKEAAASGAPGPGTKKGKGRSNRHAGAGSRKVDQVQGPAVEQAPAKEAAASGAPIPGPGPKKGKGRTKRRADTATSAGAGAGKQADETRSLHGTADQGQGRASEQASSKDAAASKAGPRARKGKGRAKRRAGTATSAGAGAGKQAEEMRSFSGTADQVQGPASEQAPANEGAGPRKGKGRAKRRAGTATSAGAGAGKQAEETRSFSGTADQVQGPASEQAPANEGAGPRKGKGRAKRRAGTATSSAGAKKGKKAGRVQRKRRKADDTTRADEDACGGGGGGGGGGGASNDGGVGAVVPEA
ncbi:MAG: RNA polymerase III transcription initiation factor complex subunit [Phylliscum demangeonii]|nr:MAG: RNA polymerase III transcription initiation factor complex subunit [Phylliscum demangeonii]